MQREREREREVCHSSAEIFGAGMFDSPHCTKTSDNRVALNGVRYILLGGDQAIQLALVASRQGPVMCMCGLLHSPWNPWCQSAIWKSSFLGDILGVPSRPRSNVVPCLVWGIFVLQFRKLETLCYFS
jgi:hypothetical protein